MSQKDNWEEEGIINDDSVGLEDDLKGFSIKESGKEEIDLDDEDDDEDDLDEKDDDEDDLDEKDDF